ncbi:putative uncharacterized protein CXorf58 homolog isoform X2 [Callorhinchus milii]|nr:putative uncharacterized protein CXorf58 homolog isoform X2 [Callorhinchus milii]
MTHDILRKLKPSEYEILKDSSMKFRVKFRFAGENFPPILVFKIFQHNMNYKTQYFSGKGLIKPATEAAADSCKLMGHRKFYDLLIDDELQFQRSQITDEVDIITLKDYMQYLSYLDETPAHLGGKDNNWRILSMDNLPRTNLLFDVVEYAQSRILSPRLKEELPVLLSLPTSQDIQLQHIKVLSQIRSSSPATSVSLRKESKTPRSSQRRSHKARLKFNKMRKIYGLDCKKKEEFIKATHEAADDHPQGVTTSALDEMYPVPNTASDEEWEKEVEKLYAWTQELSFEF